MLTISLPGLEICRLGPETIGFRDSRQTARLRLYLLANNEKSMFQCETPQGSSTEVSLIWQHPKFGAVQQEWIFSKTGDDCRAKIHWTLQPDHALDAQIQCEWEILPLDTPRFMIPGSLYGTNNIQDSYSVQPQLNYRGDLHYPKTPLIFTRADRSTHNAVLVWNRNRVLAMRIDERTHSGDSSFYNGLYVDTRGRDIYDRLGITLGYRHRPVHYKGKLDEDSFTHDPNPHPIQFAEGRTYRTDGHFFWGCQDTFDCFESPIEWFYEQIHEYPKNSGPRDEVVSELVHGIVNHGYDREHQYFPTVVSGSYAETGVAGDTAWTGGMQVAYPLLRAGFNHPEAEAIALDYISNLLETGICPSSGFFYESKSKEAWRNTGWWTSHLQVDDCDGRRLEEVHSAYINGQAACYLLKSIKILQASNQAQDYPLTNWLVTIKSLLDRVIDQQRFDGAYGVYFDPSNGEARYYNSFQGAWFFAAIAELYSVLKDPAYLASLEKADQFYFKAIMRWEPWGTPMDVDHAVDEEGNLAYITGVTTLHRMTRNEAWLYRLERAFHFEFTWKFAYNTQFVNEPLKSMNWSSSGGSITSTHNIHIHQMGNLVAEELYYLVQLTDNPYYKARLRDTVIWGLGTHNRSDGYFGYGLRGFVTEQFFHSDGVQDDIERIPDGGIWPDFLPWASSCVLLSTIADIPDEYYEPPTRNEVS